jgi:hypothetical protein
MREQYAQGVDYTALAAQRFAELNEASDPGRVADQYKQPFVDFVEEQQQTLPPEDGDEAANRMSQMLLGLHPAASQIIVYGLHQELRSPSRADLPHRSDLDARVTTITDFSLRDDNERRTVTRFGGKEYPYNGPEYPQDRATRMLIERLRTRRREVQAAHREALLERAYQRYTEGLTFRHDMQVAVEGHTAPLPEQGHEESEYAPAVRLTFLNLRNELGKEHAFHQRVDQAARARVSRIPGMTLYSLEQMMSVDPRIHGSQVLMAQQEAYRQLATSNTEHLMRLGNIKGLALTARQCSLGMIETYVQGELERMDTEEPERAATYRTRLDTATQVMAAYFKSPPADLMRQHRFEPSQIVSAFNAYARLSVERPVDSPGWDFNINEYTTDSPLTHERCPAIRQVVGEIQSVYREITLGAHPTIEGAQQYAAPARDSLRELDDVIRLAAYQTALNATATAA